MPQKALGVLISRVSDGPWRSKSVLAALAVIVLGLGFWFVDIKHSPLPDETNNPAASASGLASSGHVTASTGSRWDWGKPFPFYLRLGVSYVAGYCIGWFFRKLTRLIMVTMAMIVALLGYGKLAGCDMSHARAEVKHGEDWAQHEATTARDYLLHLLPSGTAGGAGIFLGFRRRSQIVPPKPPA